MMKNSNKKYLYLGLTIFLSLSAVILFYYILFYGESFTQVKANAINVLLPIIDGVVIAYILSPMQNFIEKKIIRPLIDKIPNKKGKNRHVLIRVLATFLTILLFLVVIAVVLLLIIPQVLDSLEIIISRFPLYMDKIDSFVTKFMDEYRDMSDLLIDYWPQIENWLQTQFLPNTTSVVSKVSSGLVGSVVSFISILLKFIIGIIISVYLLYSKETFCAQAKKIAYAFMKEESANNLINNMRYANKIFGGFITGKLVDSLIIGVLCFIGLSILKVPYALLISVLVGVTNVIPYFGPFLGAIPSALILLMINPMKCLVFLIFVLILQQFDGNVIGPKILGDSTGLSGFWVIFAITVFGGIFGVFGMFIGVPLFAVLYAAIRTFVSNRLIKRNMPDDTKYYMEYDFHTDTKDTNSGTEIKFSKKRFEIDDK
ncbi:MAG: AI-2E family transporter [Lachnospiraceae bacterium]|nr:AI-2E family transporter [Lachnospiraceae bacterium]